MIGDAVILRMLSAPEPRELMPSDLHLVQNANDVFRLELANLQVGARGEIGAPGTPLGSHLRQAVHLVRSENAAGNPHPQHERILRRRDIKQAVKLETKEIVRGRSAILIGMCEQLVPNIERILLMLPQLLAAEI